jgi:hypothetical protein
LGEIFFDYIDEALGEILIPAVKVESSQMHTRDEREKIHVAFSFFDTPFRRHV